jgi:hypothetical protein
VWPEIIATVCFWNNSAASTISSNVPVALLLPYLVRFVWPGSQRSVHRRTAKPERNRRVSAGRVPFKSTILLINAVTTKFCPRTSGQTFGNHCTRKVKGLSLAVSEMEFGSLLETECHLKTPRFRFAARAPGECHWTRVPSCPPSRVRAERDGRLYWVPLHHVTTLGHILSLQSHVRSLTAKNATCSRSLYRSRRTYLTKRMQEKSYFV